MSRCPSISLRWSVALAVALLVLDGCQPGQADSRIAGVWTQVEPKPAATDGIPYAVIRPDGSFYMLPLFWKRPLNRLTKRGDRAEYSSGADGHLVVEHARYTPSSSELRLRYLDEQGKVQLRESFSAALETNDLLAFHRVSTFTEGIDHINSATLRKLDVPAPWNLPGQILEFEGHDHLACLAYSPDGRFVISGGGDGFVRVWDVDTGLEVNKVRVGWRVKMVAISPDGALVALVRAKSDDCHPRDHLLILDLKSGNVLHDGTPLQRIYAVEFSPDQITLLACGRDKAVRTDQTESLVLWLNVDSGSERRRLQLPQRPVRTASFSGDGRFLACVLRSRDEPPIHVIDLAQERTVHLLDGRGPRDLLFSPTGSRILAFGFDWLKEWDMKTGEIVRQIENGWPYYPWAYLLDERRLLISTTGNRCCLWDLEKGMEEHCFDRQLHRVVGIALSPDGRRAVSGMHGGTMRLWELPSLPERTGAGQ